MNSRGCAKRNLSNSGVHARRELPNSRVHAKREPPNSRVHAKRNLPLSRCYRPIMASQVYQAMAKNKMLTHSFAHATPLHEIPARTPDSCNAAPRNPASSRAVLGRMLARNAWLEAACLAESPSVSLGVFWNPRRRAAIREIPQLTGLLQHLSGCDLLLLCRPRCARQARAGYRQPTAAPEDRATLVPVHYLPETHGGANSPNIRAPSNLPKVSGR